MADRSEVLELLRIADLSNQWPNLRPLHDHAMAALTKAAEEHAEQAKKAKADAEKEKAREEALKAAKAKEEEEDDDRAPVRRPVPTPSAPSGGFRG